jgi:GT2 family glycosyltransferase
VSTGRSSIAIDFGQDGNSHLFRKDGWSEPEPRYTWTAGLSSSLEIPRPDEQGEYLLELNVHPFIADGRIAAQKLRVTVNDFEVGDFEIRVTSSLECLLPWDLLEGRAAISVGFAHPTAASRSAINGEPDERLIALAFQRINLRKLHETGIAAAVPDGGDVVRREVPVPGAASAPAAVLEGHVDAYGYYAPTGSWWFVGWASRSWGDDDTATIAARFRDRTETGDVLAGFYQRPGLGGRGVGIVVALRGSPKKRQLAQSRLISLKADTAEFNIEIDGHAAAPMAVEQLLSLLVPIFAEDGADAGLAKLHARLLPHAPAAVFSAYAFDGHVDLYAHDPALGGWLYLGWVKRPWDEAGAPATALARYGNGERMGELTAAFFDRADVRGRGVGCLLFLRDPDARDGAARPLLSLEVDTGTDRLRLAGHEQEPVPPARLVAALRPELLDAPAGTRRADLKSALLRYMPATDAGDGHIDFYGYDGSLEGWLFCGWLAAAWDEQRAPVAVAQFVDGDISGEPVATFFYREEVAGRGVGVVLLLRSPSGSRERLLSLELEFAETTVVLRAAEREPSGEAELREAVRPLLLHGEITPERGGLRKLLADDAGAAAVRTADPGGLDGHVDFYGYLAEAAAWFFCGWVSKPWGEEEKPIRIVAHFEDGTASGEASLAAFHYRDDIEARGVGFVLALPCPERDRDHLTSLELEFAAFSASLATTMAGPGLSMQELVDWLNPLLSGGEANSNRSRLRSMLRPATAEAADPATPQGFVDFYGYHGMAGGWLFCGWVSSEVDDPAGAATVVTARFERGEVRGESVRLHYARDDLGDRGLGLVLFISAAGTPLGGLLSVTIEAGDGAFRIYPGAAIQRLREQELLSGLRAIVAGAPPGGQRDVMLAILRRQGFVGADTIGELGERVFVEIDEAIVCGPDSLVLIGWHLAKPNVVRALRLRCGTMVSTINLDDSVAIDRPDVVAAVGEQHGFDDVRCGFIVFLPHAVDGANAPYLEIETRRGEVGYRTVPAPRLEGIAATKRLLECFDVRFLDVPRAYDRVIGPAVELLTKSRLRTGPAITALEFGEPPVRPEFSVIIPLHGRIDFVEYQMALFSAHAPNSGYEFIYLLDDPPKRREAQFLFTSVFERFRVPFRALLFDRNVGFAPTNNIGLRHARGKYVCFLNSDAFPGTPDWLERLAARLAARPELGAVGPLLLYEDGSIQHQGMSFRRLNEFGGWHFGHHPGKGLQPGVGGGMRRCISITGACMLLERSLAERMHGFDESYAIGDFEDSDLCLRLYRMGLGCAVDLDVHLYHLERKSQGSSARNWRLNLTLYNAWFHERRWARAIAAHPYALATAPLLDEASAA